jgi:hypothetical protein
MIRCSELILFVPFVYYLRLQSVERWKNASEGSNHGLIAVLLHGGTEKYHGIPQ